MDMARLTASAAAYPATVSASAYVGASRSHQDLAGWRPPKVSGAGALPAGDRHLLSSRVQDQNRNDAWSVAGTARQVDAIIGAGWGLAATPNRRRLGLTEQAAAEIAAQIESEFQDYADDPDCWCDAARMRNFGGLLALGYRHRAVDGEALAVIQYLDRGGPWATALDIVDPDRLAQPPEAVESTAFRDGIELRGSEPIAYHIRLTHPSDYARTGEDRFVRVPRYVDGRRIVLHAFEPSRAGEVRGVSALAPIVKKLRMLGRYDEAELQAAVLNAVMAAFVTSPYDPKEAMDALAAGEAPGTDGYNAARAAFWEQSGGVRLDGAQVNFLYQGEKVEFSPASHPNAVFEHFTRASLRNIAAAMGISYEQLSADWSQVNYSSARAALLEVWRGFTARAGFFAAQFVQPFYVRWFEEAVARGRIKLPAGSPSFEEAKTAWTRARWRMPGRGWVDPLKEAQAAGERMLLGISTLDREAAEQGADWEELLVQRAREMARAAELEKQNGLAPGSLLGGGTSRTAPAATDPAPDPAETRTAA